MTMDPDNTVFVISFYFNYEILMKSLLFGLRTQVFVLDSLSGWSSDCARYADEVEYIVR